MASHLDRERLLEGEQVLLRLEVSARRGAEHLEVEIGLPAGLSAEREAFALRLRRSERRTLSVAVAAARWGAYRLPQIRLVARDRFGFFLYETHRRPARQVATACNTAEI